ncbi:MAG: circularly permuted type 2 ATP-grasp protein [Candidatus Binatia bacterium]
MRSSSKFTSYRVKPDRYDEVFASAGQPRDPWEQLAHTVSQMGQAELKRHARTIRRTVEQDGVTYNIYADAKGADRPWEVDLLPLIIGPEEWRLLARAVAQRARLLNAVLADLYGSGRMLAEGLLPPAIIYGHRNYLWPCRGVEPLGGIYLHLYGCDLARSPDGRWWVVADRTQGPSGAGYALQNRLIIGPMYGTLFRTLGVQRLAHFFRTLQQRLAALAPTDGEPPLIALLTPGPYNETYFEHVFLARYLGFALVEGADLTVRDNRVYLKTLEGLKRVHVLLRRLDDEYCDPVALRADSALGVPGLLAAAQAGHVVIANALGSGVLETPALLGFLPGICQALLGEALALPSVATWWCGETPALDHVVTHLPDLVIKPAFPSMKMEPTFGYTLDAAARADMVNRLRDTPHAYVAQEWVRLSQAPTWVSKHQRFEPRAIGVRLYAVAGANGYEVMPGGLTRVSPETDTEVISMQRGGSSKDTWVLEGAAIHWESLLQPRVTARDIVRGRRYSPSRAGENSFWMGRYAERVENLGRLLRATARRLVENDPVDSLGIEVLLALCDAEKLRETPKVSRRSRKKTETLLNTANNSDAWLIAAVGDARVENGLAANSARLLYCTTQIRERISLDNWYTVQRLVHDHEPAPTNIEEAIIVLNRILPACTALAGYAFDDMTRDDAWQFLLIGRQIERLAFLASTVNQILLRPAAKRDAALGGLLEVGNSLITYRARYQRQPELLPVIDLLVFDESNPHAVCFQLVGLGRALETLAERLGFQPVNDLRGLIRALHNFDLAPLDDLGRTREPASRHDGLVALLTACQRSAYGLSDEIAQRFFIHARERAQTSVAA